MIQYYITEWTSATNTRNIPIFIYTLPVQDTKDRFRTGTSIVYELTALNQQVIAAYDQYIISRYRIQNWGQYEVLLEDHRPIDVATSHERKLFEQLLKKELEAATRDTHEMDKGAFRLRNAKPLKTDEINIYPAIQLSFHIGSSGEIVAGFDYVHRFEYRDTLEQLMSKKGFHIQMGEAVIDYTNYRKHEYSFVELASYTAGEESPFLKQSVIDYYKTQNKLFKIKGVTEQHPVVHVRGQNGNIFPYLPKLLKLRCSFDTLPSHLHRIATKAIKLGPEEKMVSMLKETQALLYKLRFLEWPKSNVLAPRQGYDITKLSTPNLLFRDGQAYSSVSAGMNKGIYESGHAKVSYFVDPFLQQNPHTSKLVGGFIHLLQNESRRLGVELEPSFKPRELRGQLAPNLFRLDELSYHLKSIKSYFEGTVVVIASEQNINQAYWEIKREFGGKQDITTQFVVFHPNLLEPKQSRYTYLNILLGIYVKSGLQPWLLQNPLHSDCYIGLDVSHEDGRHSSGIIQVVGKDGRMLRQSSLSTNESGEIISWTTMKDILVESIHSYEKTYGSKPIHITFHRDGFCREDLDKIEEFLERMGIHFDYVEILKNTKRRMALYENKTWSTQQSLAYIKGQTGYLCSTSPKEFVGMAKPIKVVQKTNHLSIKEIMEDIYRLSFMHIHSMLKTRLPITTHYADLSSTFHNRGMIHPSTEHETALPFV